VMDGFVDQALAEARAAGVGGKDETPFLLKRINELTGGRSLAVNIGLIRSNARLAARIAKALA
jgi:pseudouridylate synthase